MKQSIAKIISYLFHPVFAPTYGFALILFTNNYFSYFFNDSIKWLLLAVTFSFTAVLPFFNLMILKRFRLISSFFLQNARERTFPYLITSLFYVGLIYLIKDYRLPGIYVSFLIASAICIFIAALINLKWKISAHLIGNGGLAGSILAISWILHQNWLPWLCLMLFISGLTAFARIVLEEHTPQQTYAGFLLGFIGMFFLLIGAYIINLHTIF
jgi:membrane-associated phospholipid phosphatase